MMRSLAPRPRRLRRRGRSSAQSRARIESLCCRTSARARPIAPAASWKSNGVRCGAPNRHVTPAASSSSVPWPMAFRRRRSAASTQRRCKSYGKLTGRTARDRSLGRSRLGRGSKLFREWHGETHEVLVLDKGFAWRGESYPSLSAIARAITGAHWNGWAFFGLKRRTKEAPANG